MPNSSFYFRISIILWAIAIIGVSLQLYLFGMQRSMTPIYHDAVDHWLHGKPLYYGPKEFNYLPFFTQLFRPFHALPIPVGDILWRVIACLGMSVGLWKVTRLLGANNHGRAYFVITLLSLPLCISALRNGQSSAHIAAFMVLTAWFLYLGQWWPAAISLILTLALKPLGLPAIGLALMLFPVIWWRLLLGVAIVILSPYLFGSTDYVSNQYLSFMTNINQCMVPTEGRTFADLNGALRLFGREMDRDLYLFVQVSVGLVFAAISFVIGKSRNLLAKALIFLSLTACYIMLLTPMNEANSYVMLAPSLGLWAVWLWKDDNKLASSMVAAIALAMSFSSEIISVLFGARFTNDYNQSMMPMLAVAFLSITLTRAAIEIGQVHTGVSNRSFTTFK